MELDPLAIDYLIPRDDSFWTWDEAGETVVFRQGEATLAFREELRILISRWKDLPLIRFDLILAVLAASRQNWPEHRELFEWRQVIAGFRGLANPPVPILTLISGLDRWHQLPLEVRRHPAVMIKFLESMSSLGSQSSPRSNSVVALLSQRNWLFDLQAPTRRSPFLEVKFHDWCDLASRLSRFDAAELIAIAKVANGEAEYSLDAIQKLDELTDHDSIDSLTTLPKLLDTLETDAEFATLVRATRRLSAVLTLPRPLTAPEVLPQGGVSDLSNRGTLDRLALSELANDDETLMVRVALNEALYVLRETPPQSPVLVRSILIDCGIRTWGFPRLLGTAAALSLLSNSDRCQATEVFCSSRKGLVSTSLISRDGLVAQKNELDPGLHPGANLDAWVHTSQTDNDQAEIERILITSDEVLDDLEFRGAMSAAKLAPAFVITVSRQGEIRLLQLTKQGIKELKHLWIEPNSLLTTSSGNGLKINERRGNADLPAALQQETFPFRVSQSVDQKARIVAYARPELELNGLLQLTNDGRLVCWDTPGVGARQVTDQLPSGKLIFCGDLGSSNQFAMLFSQKFGRLGLLKVTINPSKTFQTEQLDLGSPHLECQKQTILGVAAQETALLLVTRSRVLAICSETGVKLAESAVHPKTRWLHGRFFHSGEAIQVLSLSGSELRFDSLLPLAPFNQRREQVLGVVGPVGNRFAVINNNELYHLSTGKRQLLTGVPNATQRLLHRVSDCGNHFLIRSFVAGNQSAYWRYQIHGPDQIKCVPFFRHDYDLLSPQVSPSQRPKIQQPRTLTRNTFLQLHTLQHGTYELLLNSDQQMIWKLASHPTGSTKIQPRSTPEFVTSNLLAGTRMRLFKIIWPDGSIAWSDRRGILHLRSSDLSVPQLSLVLTPGQTAGWSSRREYWGAAYYFDEYAGNQRITDQEGMDLVSRFLARLP